MPVFSCEQVAKAAQKDAKTIRIWCARGFVPGARRKRGGKGRHWRIEGKNAATIAGHSLRAARSVGHSRNRKRTGSGKIVPAEMLRRVARLKKRLRAQRDPQKVLLSWVLERGEFLDHGETTHEIFMRANPAELLASALANGIIEEGATKDAARILGARFGWSRATFYRKFGNLLPMAKRIAASYDNQPTPSVSREWNAEKNNGAGGYEPTGFALDESILSKEQIRYFNSMAANG
jgi:hypothetical protein